MLLFGFYRDIRLGLGSEIFPKQQTDYFYVRGELVEKGVWTTKPHRVGKEERFGEKVLRNNRDGYLETSADWRTMIFIPQALWFKS